MSDWTEGVYTSDLQKTAAAIPEMIEILRLWEPGMKVAELTRRVIEAGALARVSTVRVTDIVARAFKRRFLEPSDRSASLARQALDRGASASYMKDLNLLHCLKTDLVIYDFLLERYWPSVYAGHESMTGKQIVSFLKDKFGTERNPEGWSESVAERVARNLGKALTDFGFFENRRSTIRRFDNFEVSTFLFSYILIDGHEAGIGDTALLALPEWEALGLARAGVVDRCRRLAGVNGPFIFQFSGELAQFTWRFNTVREFIDVSLAA